MRNADRASRLAALGIAATLACAVVPAGAVGADPAPARFSADPAASAAPRQSTAIFIPRGYFFRPTIAWTRTTIRTGYFDALRTGPSTFRLQPWRTLGPRTAPSPLPFLRGLPPGPARLEALGASLGDRMVTRLRLQVERDADLAAGEDDLFREFSRRKLLRELAIEMCGALLGNLAPAVSDGRVSGSELASFVSATRAIGRDYAARVGTRGSYTEAAYLGLTAADYAEGVVDVANDPSGYVSSRLSPPSAGQQLRDNLVAIPCRVALRGSGLSRVSVIPSSIPSFSVLQFSALWYSPALPARATANGLSCVRAPSRELPIAQNCSWVGAFS